MRFTTMPNVSQLTAASSFAGFKNYSSVTGTGTIPSQLLTATGVATTTIVIPLNNSNAISTIQAQFTTTETFWREMMGFVETPIIGGNYQMEALSFYSGGNLNVICYAINQSGAPFTIPAQTINIQAKLYKSPF